MNIVMLVVIWCLVSICYSIPNCSDDHDNRPCVLSKNWNVTENMIRAKYYHINERRYWDCYIKLDIPCKRWGMVYWSKKLMLEELFTKPKDQSNGGIKLSFT